MAWALLLAATVQFTAPRDGAQVIGRTLLEVATDATEIDRVEFVVDGTLVGVARTAPYRLMHDFGASLAPHRIVAHVRSHRFQQDDVAEVRTLAVGGETITVNMVEVPARIRATGPVSAKDLRIVEDDKPQTIRDVLFERPAARFVFLVDRSSSMNEGKLAAALSAIDGALELLRPGDTAQIIFFNHNFGQLEDLPRGVHASAKYADVEPSGGTALRDAVVSTIQEGRTNTIVITDGSDRNSEISDEAALRKISGTNSAFFALVFDQASSFLEKASSNTGGDIRTVSAQSVRGEMRELIADINSRYLLTYQSTGRKKGWRTIKVSSTRFGVSVMKARKGYFSE